MQESEKFLVEDEAGNTYEVIKEVLPIPAASLDNPARTVDGMNVYRTRDGLFVQPLGKEINPVDFEILDGPERIRVHRTF
jgi:hypothetical protein